MDNLAREVYTNIPINQGIFAYSNNADRLRVTITEFSLFRERLTKGVKTFADIIRTFAQLKAEILGLDGIFVDIHEYSNHKISGLINNLNYAVQSLEVVPEQFTKSQDKFVEYFKNSVIRVIQLIDDLIPELRIVLIRLDYDVNQKIINYSGVLNSKIDKFFKIFPKFKDNDPTNFLFNKILGELWIDVAELNLTLSDSVYYSRSGFKRIVSLILEELSTLNDLTKGKTNYTEHERNALKVYKAHIMPNLVKFAKFLIDLKVAISKG